VNVKTFALVGLFIVILVALLWRCSVAKGAEFDLDGGASFGPGRTGPVLGLQIYQPIGNRVDVFAGTNIWGKTSIVATTWDWHAGIRTCRWEVCASLGASYLQNVDRVNGSHTNYYLGLAYLFDWGRLRSFDYCHLSDLGTTPINKGRNAALVSIRLQ
jgi:hypothetical protein